MPRTNLRSAIVVGAGLSGLAAARTLERAGINTTVLESQDQPGGRVRTERVGRYLVDTGPDAATGSYKRWLALVDELGLSSRLTQPSPVLGVIRSGRIVDVDPGAPLKALTTPLLSRRAKLKLLAGAARLA